jgi:YesN/AraC family two-component response regulator
MFLSSLEALDFFKENYDTIDLVITDQTMPEKTGFDLAGDMLKIRKDIPIILCSGYAGMLNREKMKKAGIRKFFMKPVAVEDLSREIQRILKK